ncbi:PHA/PHB synthase family protein [Phaeovulum sp.]|uniref:PHA/PHB synthase family protein n=1 Tax=Phaeovulum sp. TaxID=2934796 RepID=UPI0039E25F9A
MSSAGKKKQAPPDRVVPIQRLQKTMEKTATPFVEKHGSDSPPDPVSPDTDPRPSWGMPDYPDAERLGHAIRAYLARVTMGAAADGLSSSFLNWWMRLASSPEKQRWLLEKMARHAVALGQPHPQAPPDRAILPPKHDDRFDAPEWQHWPFDLIQRNFRLTQRWWHEATNNPDGMPRRDDRIVSLVARQMLDMVSPSNGLWTNPEVIAQTMREGGGNLIRGAQYLLEDWQREISGEPPIGAENYMPGRDVAVTPGKVVFRTHLLELIQYAPQTDSVAAEPIMIVPAWIMKYYILDLSPENSLVRFLVRNGFTVFMISWRNPDTADRDLGLSDYLDAVGQALDAIGAIMPDTQVHAVGYCLGGTLLSAKAAQMARDKDQRLKTMTLFATQTDFEDPGESQLLINEHNVTFLEHLMSGQGYLDTKQMVDAFKILQSRDSIWPQYVSDYLMGRRHSMTDLAAWSADATRLPYRMQSEYLRHIVLDNELAQGRYEVGGTAVKISDISVPMFCVLAFDDYVAPWQSVYKLHLLTNADLTFVLTSGGHIDGIVSDPEKDGALYQIAAAPDKARHEMPEDWRVKTPVMAGSWWPELAIWLRHHGGGSRNPPPMGTVTGQTSPLTDAPGTYVFQR